MRYLFHVALEQSSFLRFYGPTRINYRNHRKIVVADGHQAWVGGHNVGVEYLGESPRFGRWRDTQVHVKGPAAIACAMVFREDWQWATGEDLALDLAPTIETPGDQSVLVMPTGPADRLEDCAIAFTDIISKAQNQTNVALARITNEAPDIVNNQGLYSSTPNT